ncbi:MAG: membrane protein insertion efficiency factor YidD [Myxococcota bacterium]
MNAVLLAALLGFGPFGTDRHPVTSEVRRASAPLRSLRGDDTFFQLSYDFYRTVVSPIDGARCAHRPTCSRYGLLSVRRHGVVGMLLTFDRLLRAGESSALRKLRLLEDGETLHLLDPLEESTFWFSPSSS